MMTRINVRAALADPLWAVNLALACVILRLHWTHAMVDALQRLRAEAAAAAAEAAARLQQQLQMEQEEAVRRQQRDRPGNASVSALSLSAGSWLGAWLGYVALNLLLAVAAVFAMVVLAAVIRMALRRFTGKQYRENTSWVSVKTATASQQASPLLSESGASGAAAAVDQRFAASVSLSSPSGSHSPKPAAAAAAARGHGGQHSSSTNHDWETVSEESGPSSRSVSPGVVDPMRTRAAAQRGVAVVETAAVAASPPPTAFADRAASTDAPAEPDIFALIHAYNAQRQSDICAAQLTIDEFEQLRSDVHRQLFHADVGEVAPTDDERAAPWMLNASSVRLDETLNAAGATAPPSSIGDGDHLMNLSETHHPGHAVRARDPPPPPLQTLHHSHGPSGKKVSTLSMAECLHDAAVACCLDTTTAGVELANDVDIEALFAGYCRVPTGSLGSSEDRFSVSAWDGRDHYFDGSGSIRHLLHPQQTVLVSQTAN